MGEQNQVDARHCFKTSCMEELRRVVLESQAELVISSSWRQLLETIHSVFVEGKGR